MQWYLIESGEIVFILICIILIILNGTHPHQSVYVVYHITLCIILWGFVPLWLYYQFLMGPRICPYSSDCFIIDTVEMISLSQGQWKNPEGRGLNWLTPNHNKTLKCNNWVSNSWGCTVKALCLQNVYALPSILLKAMFQNAHLCR